MVLTKVIHSKLHLDWFIYFRTAYGRVQHTGRETELHAPSAVAGRIYAWRACDVASSNSH